MREVGMIKRVLLGFAISGLAFLGLQHEAYGFVKPDKVGTLTDSLVVYRAQRDSLSLDKVNDQLTKSKKANVGVLCKKLEISNEDEKTPVHPQDLPNAVRTALEEGDFRDWKTKSASLVKPHKGETYYEIALLKGEITKIAKFKGNGKVL